MFKTKEILAKYSPELAEKVLHFLRHSETFGFDGCVENLHRVIDDFEECFDLVNEWHNRNPERIESLYLCRVCLL